MDKLSALEKEWVKTLQSRNPSIILPALHEIKNSGSVKILPYLFGLISGETDGNIRNNVLQLIGEIKTQDAVPYIVKSIENHEFGEYLTPLIASCWQCGLDFSAYLPVFARIFTFADYITAIEAFTVIEESLLYATDKIRMECLKVFNESENLITKEKLQLYKELHKLIENI